MAEQRLHMAQGIEKAGNLPVAISNFQQVIDKYPGTPQVRTAEQKIAELTRRIKHRTAPGLE